MKPKALVAELFGTFSLTLAVFLSLNSEFPVPTPVIAGLTLGLFVYTIGSISGTHINPAVTVALAALKKIDLPNAAGYIVAQFLGAGIAMWLGRTIFAMPTELTVSNTVGTGLAEALGAVLFLFGITAVVLGLVPAAMSGAVIGGSLLLGIQFAAHSSNGVLNPAVAFGIGSFSAAYVWGPIVGAVAGAVLCANLASDGDEAVP